MNLLQSITSSKDKLTVLEKKIPLEDHKRRLNDIDEIMSHNPDIWNNKSKAAELLKERQKLENLINSLSAMKNSSDTLFEFIQEFPADSAEYEKDVLDLESKVNAFEITLMFKDPLDNSPAILSISAGAGGLEAANWVTMLLRMYSRYIQAYGFTSEMIDYKASEGNSDICTDSVSIRITGEFAYGFFKNEAGVHRLIRNSPFNSGDARHTSFAAVAVSADIEDTIDIKIEDKDIEITSQTAGRSWTGKM